MRILTKTALACFACLLMIAGCESAPTKPVAESDQQYLRTQADATLARFRERNGGVAQMLDTAHGYAVFPEITKGAVGIGGAYGRGVVYEQGEFVGYTTVKQASIGAQLGGQEFAQIVFFEDQASLESFKRGNFELDARASAVAADEATGTTADFEDGVAVYTLSRSGLMFEASVGGQKFDYIPA